MTSPTVFLKNASLTYQGKVLFSKLNFTLAGGQWTCLLGPSGVGKTSLLRILAGLPTTTDMTAEIKIAGDISHREAVAYMGQTDMLLPWRNSLDNVLIERHLRGDKIRDADIARAVNLLQAMGLKEALYQKPSQLSGGMRQRVALARTLFADKPIVLMDEPFASLDAITRWRLQTLAFTMLAGKTVLLITHDPMEALRLGHHIYVLSGCPATLDTPLMPEGAPLRSSEEGKLMHDYEQLMANLSKARYTT